MRFLYLLLLFTLVSCTPDNNDTDVVSDIRQLYDRHLDSLYNSVHLLSETPADEPILLKKRFETARLHFKKIEVFGEFYHHDLMTKINGPAIQKQNLHDNIRVYLPVTGFQKIEELIYAEENPDTDLLSIEMLRLTGLVDTWRNDSQTVLLNDKNVTEAVKRQFLRISGLGISGFDSPVALLSLQEAAASLQSAGEYLGMMMEENEEMNILSRNLERAINTLDSANNFESFDRFDFLVNYLKPAYDQLLVVQAENGIENNKWISAVNLDQKMFSDQFFNADYFAPSYNRNVSVQQVTLGKKLFSEQMLSSDQSRSCVSCHDPAQSFTDGRKRSISLSGDSTILRNAPTLLNSGFQMSQFYDSRVTFLEEQVLDVVNNKEEMHGSLDQAVERLVASEKYKVEFTEVFGRKDITPRDIQKAIASYVRSLESLNSRFDLALREETELTQEELDGFNLFMGKAKCGTCHFFPLFNGTVPPQYNESESEVLGVPAQYITEEALNDPDSGKYHVYLAETHLYAFKTPTIRNVQNTAPYMHNGAMKTLEEVLDFYNRGGGAGIGIDLPNQTLPPDTLGLTVAEQQKIIAFMEALESPVEEPSKLLAGDQ